MPRQALFVELFHERVRIEFFNIPYTRFFPQSLEEHHGTNHGGHTGGIAYALHTGFLVGLLVATVVIYIVGTLFAIL